MTKILYLIAVFALLSCSNNTSEKEENSKTLEELSYIEIVKTVMIGDGKRIEYHGKGAPTDEIESVSIEISEESCPGNDCGKIAYIVNNSDKRIKSIVYSPFIVGTLESHTASEYILDPQSKIKIGCTDFCFDGNSYKFNHTIAGAGAIN